MDSDIIMTMLYRPSGELTLWDTWIFPAGDIYHLFHLLNDPKVRARIPFNLGHAVSSDLVHWQACDDIQVRGVTRGRTGMVIRYGESYAMSVGWSAMDGIQCIGLMFSDDLYRWEAHPQNPVLTAGPPYLKGEAADWRDGAFYATDDGFEALVCARLPDKRPCIARLTSRDLVHWEHQEPAAVPPQDAPVVSQCEVPEYFAMGGSHYLLFSCGGPVDTSTRWQAKGTHYLISDRRAGRYTMRPDSLLVGSASGQLDAYVGRTIDAESSRLLYYHNCGPRPSLAAPKIIHQAGDGSLWAGYWKGISGLESEVLFEGIPPTTRMEKWRSDGDELRCDSPEGRSHFILSADVRDFHLTCTVVVLSGDSCSLLFRFDEDSRRGAAFILNAEKGSLEIAEIDGPEWLTRDSMSFPTAYGSEYRLRLFARSEFVDGYIDDRLVFSVVLNNIPDSGRTGFEVQSASACFKEIRIAALEPL